MPPFSSDKMQNQNATIYIGNIDPQVMDSMVWELMLQVGPVVGINLPKDRVSMCHNGFGFCEFKTEEDAEYAIIVMDQIKLFGKPLKVNKAMSSHMATVVTSVGAELHVSGLDSSVNEKQLCDTFSWFGLLMAIPRIHEDNTPQEKLCATVSFTNFDASDAAIWGMNGQHLGGHPISVSYAYKKDGKKGERHGSHAERCLANLGKKNNYLRNEATQVPSVDVMAGFMAPPEFPHGFTQVEFNGAVAPFTLGPHPSQ
jgi:splicing factor 3B subunit 4